MRIPTRIDRYPAKMVFRLADQLVERYAGSARRLLDPLCGSGAVLSAAHRRGIPVSGVDLNPVAALLSSVKLNGFSGDSAVMLANELVSTAQASPILSLFNGQQPVIGSHQQHWVSLND